MSDNRQTENTIPAERKPRTRVYIVGSGEYIADTATVGEYLKTHSRKQMVADILDAWGSDCFKRTARSRKTVRLAHLSDNRVALDTLPTYVLAVILNQL